MSKRLFDYDPLTGTTQWFEATQTGFNLITESDPTDIIEMNKKKQAMGRAYYAADKDMWRVASVPNIVLLQWATELGIPASHVYSDEYADVLAKKLRSSEFRDLKTADIRI